MWPFGFVNTGHQCMKPVCGYAMRLALLSGYEVVELSCTSLRNCIFGISYSFFWTLASFSGAVFSPFGLQHGKRGVANGFVLK